MAERLRLAEILTTSSAVANYLGARDVSATHVLAAIDILLGSKTLDDLGRPLSPLVSRAAGAGSGAAEDVKELARRWLAELEGDIQRELTDTQLGRLRAELEAQGEGRD